MLLSDQDVLDLESWLLSAEPQGADPTHVVSLIRAKAAAIRSSRFRPTPSQLHVLHVLFELWRNTSPTLACPLSMTAGVAELLRLGWIQELPINLFIITNIGRDEYCKRRDP